MRGATKNRVKLCLVLAGLSLVASATATAGDLPPIGQRRYVIDDQNPYAPVAIKQGRDGKEAKAVTLKDPLQPSKQAKVVQMPKRAPVKDVAAKPVSKPTAKSGQLRFGRMSVQGHVAQPRVEFANETVPLERADEPLYQDFFNKIFAPADDTSF